MDPDTQGPRSTGPQVHGTSGPQDPQVPAGLGTRAVRKAAERLAARRLSRADRAEDLKAQQDLSDLHRSHADKVRADRLARRTAAAERRREVLSERTPEVLSMAVYLAAVGSAIFGQVSVATGRYHWGLWRALLLAGFIELMALAMALTANRLRLRGERAFAPRALTWSFAGFAATVNIWGHWSDHLMATGLGAASLGGIALWEIRSSARHRDALRAAGQIAKPGTRFGWRTWIRYPRDAAAAWSADVLYRLTPEAGAIMTKVRADRTRRSLAAEVLSVARTAADRGKPGPALDALTKYADLCRTQHPEVPALGGPEVCKVPSAVEVLGTYATGPGGSANEDRTTVLTPGPDDCSKVRDIRSANGGSVIETYVVEVRKRYPDRVPRFSEVREVLEDGLGLGPSKSRVTRVLKAIREEEAS